MSFKVMLKFFFESIRLITDIRSDNGTGLEAIRSNIIHTSFEAESAAFISEAVFAAQILRQNRFEATGRMMCHFHSPSI